jgi:hypothetical protein
LQAVLPPDLVLIATMTLLFAMTAGCSVFLAIGQAIFQTCLKHCLNNVVSQEEANKIIAAGAAGFRQVLQSGDHDAVIDVYNTAVTNVFVSYSSEQIIYAEPDSSSSTSLPQVLLLPLSWSAA